MTTEAMIRVRYKRPRSFGSARAIRDEVKSLIVSRLVMGLTDMQNSILETPVYTGKTMANYHWSTGAPNMSIRPAISQPSLPGKTSEMPLGSEPRRKANSQLVIEEFMELLASVRANPFQDIYLTNSMPHFSEIEHGTYAAEGKQSRTPPGGMTRRGETLLEYSMMGLMRRV
jgi:hypothetical protein